MFKNFLSISKINTESMLRHGSVAIITMFGIGILFGEKNIMMAFPIALMSVILEKQNIHIKTLSKIFRLIILNLFIVFTAYVASTSFLIGIPINLIAIFFIMYTLISPYDMTFYKPFIMLYVFTQYSTASISDLPNKFLSVTLGILVVAFFGVIFNSSKEKKLLSKGLKTSFSLIRSQIEKITLGDFDESIKDNCTKAMREIAYRIYISRHKKYLLTYFGRIEFNIYLSVEHLNLYLLEYYKVYNISLNDDSNKIIELIKKMEAYCNNEIELSVLKKYFKDANLKVRHIEASHIYKVLKNILNCFMLLEKLKRKQRNKVYKKWKRSEIDRFKTTFKEYFKPGTIRFKFAVRTSITLTFALFIGEMLGLYKVIWAIITIMSIINPYYEDTIKRSKDRIKGNVVAILFVGVALNIVDTKGFTIIILGVSVYMLYAYKEYYKKSLYSGIATICVATLSENINTLIFYRVCYVFIGVFIVIIANKFLLPYRIKDGISQLMIKIMRLNNILIKETIGYVKGENNSYDIRDVILHLTLLNQKLYMRNLQYGDVLVNKFISINNKITIETGYKLLKEYKNNHTKKPI